MAFQEGFNPFGGILKSKGEDEGGSGGGSVATHTLSVEYENLDEGGQLNEEAVVWANGKIMPLVESTIPTPNLEVSEIPVMQCEVPAGAFIFVYTENYAFDSVQFSAFDVPIDIALPMGMQDIGDFGAIYYIPEINPDNMHKVTAVMPDNDILITANVHMVGN